MHYIDVQWIHDSLQHPIRLVSELDDERCETRKLEFFPNGVVGIASSSFSTSGSRLGEGAIPTLETINADPQFHGVAIEQREFDELWKKYATSGA